jgi:outer membrane protein OmpA-like peptidoglycan-associated protein
VFHPKKHVRSREYDGKYYFWRSDMPRHTKQYFCLLIFILLLISGASFAQDEPTPKIDIFAGYQWLDPGATVPTFVANPPVGTRLPSMPKGLGATATYNFSKFIGLSLDAGGNWHDIGHETTLSVGPRLMWRNEGFNLFGHTMLGLNQLKAGSLDTRNGIGAILGGGMDMRLWHGIYWRVFEADYVWSPQRYSDEVPPEFPNLRHPNLEGVRLRTGLVFSYGGKKTEPLTSSCSVQPAEVMVGEPVTANVTVSNANLKHTLGYQWSSDGGKVIGKDNTASIDTNGVAGGIYTVTARISDPKTKRGGETTCSAKFTVKEPPKNPPTMSLSASPTSVQPGGTIALTASCTSPDNVPVTVSDWTAGAGTVSGSGASATLNTAGAQPGSIQVSASCSDSRGLTGSASTQVAVEAPPAPPPVSEETRRLEARLALHSIYFATAKPTAQNPNGGLVASQQGTLTALASDFQKYLEVKPDAHLILEGHADPRGSVPYNQALSERRVERAKNFLVEHGVPAGSIEVKALGEEHNLSDDEVKQSIESNPELTNEERRRITRNMRTIILASNRRVDITLSSTGQTSVRQYPFNAADSLTLIGGREGAVKKTPKKKAIKKK